MAALTRHAILAVNSGSSSLKASLFRTDETRRDWHFRALTSDGKAGVEDAFDRLLAELGDENPDAVCHRVVHGGDTADRARLLDDAEITRLERLSVWAPLHQPDNLRGVALCRARFDVPQIACFDTAFHASMPELARRLPVPAGFGLRRYGFHGLSYAHVADQLPGLLGERARGRIVVAHLGSGASLCLLDALQSVDTTMGCTPAGGIPMATRSGDLDPGVLLHLLQHQDAATVTEQVYRHMGLLALSGGESGDMETLLASPTPAARFAVDYFCREVRAAIGGFAAKAGGLDALVFTGGIGENAPHVRARICEPLRFLGVVLDAEANLANRATLQAEGFKPVLRITSDEERVMRAETEALLDDRGRGLAKTQHLA